MVLSSLAPSIPAVERKHQRIWRHFLHRRSLRRCAERPMASSTIYGGQSGSGWRSGGCVSPGQRDGAAAKRFFKRLLRTTWQRAQKIVTDKLRSYPVAHRELIPDVLHDTSQYANNRGEQSHEPTRMRERVRRRFKSMKQARDSWGSCGSIESVQFGAAQVRAQHYRDLRVSAFTEWSRAIA